MLTDIYTASASTKVSAELLLDMEIPKLTIQPNTKMQKTLKNAVSKAVEGNTWKKFTNPSAGRGKTAFPKGQAEQERVGVRWDYDGEVVKGDNTYHKFQMQPNAGKVPSSIKRWREDHGGTHAVMATALVKKDGSKEEVEAGLAEATESVTR